MACAFKQLHLLSSFLCERWLERPAELQVRLGHLSCADGLVDYSCNGRFEDKTSKTMRQQDAASASQTLDSKLTHSSRPVSKPFK